jgi:hypothetical protein
MFQANKNMNNYYKKKKKTDHVAHSSGYLLSCTHSFKHEYTMMKYSIRDTMFIAFSSNPYFKTIQSSKKDGYSTFVIKTSTSDLLYRSGSLATE